VIHASASCVCVITNRTLYINSLTFTFTSTSKSLGVFYCRFWTTRRWKDGPYREPRLFNEYLMTHRPWRIVVAWSRRTWRRCRPDRPHTVISWVRRGRPGSLDDSDSRSTTTASTIQLSPLLFPRSRTCKHRVHWLDLFSHVKDCT